MNKETIIKIEKLERYYKSGEIIVKAIDKINLDIKRGEFVAVMGASGSGKTTLLRILGLMDFQTNGDYSVLGLNVKNIPEEERIYYRLTQLGYVFQDYALINELTALENVYILSLMEGKSKKQSIEIAKEALIKVGLKNKENRIPDELSGGEKQRVAIARAIAKKPGILFADEPCANLDTINSEQVLQVFKQLNKNYNQTIVMVTHEDWHTKFVSRIIRLKDGKIIQDKKTNQHN